MGGEQRWVHNDTSGSAELVLQVGTIEGDVHFHRPQARTPRQLPSRIDDLLNQVRVLRELDEGTAERPELDDPLVKVVLGPRGSGKSTVATYWLHGCQESYPHGQLYANLGAWADHQTAPREVLGEFLVALGVSRSDLPVDVDTRAAMFRSITHDRSLQVFLDDVLSPAQVRTLLPGRGRSIVVATGHGPFGVLRQTAKLIDVAPLEPDMAVALLAQFAGGRIDDEPDARDAVLELCAGLPVALCLVGSLLAEQADLSLVELLDELTDPEGGITEVAVGDQPTLSALFDLTYRRLTAQAQACYRALGVHPAGDDLDIATLAAALGTPERRLRGAVRELVALRVVEQPVAGRVVVHNLIRQHARRVLDATSQGSERADMRGRVVAWYLAGAVAADHNVMPQRVWRSRLFPDLMVDTAHPGATDSRVWLEAERVNLRAVVSTAFELGDLDAAIRLCVVLWSLYEPGKFYDDLLETHALGVRAAEHLGADLARAVLLTQMGFAHLHRGEPDTALATCLVAVEAARRAGDTDAEATALEAAGLAELDQGDAVRARELLRRNLEMAGRIGDPRRTALARFHLAKTEPANEALRLLDQALEGFRALPTPEPRNLAKIMTWQGRKHTQAGSTAEARECLDRALAITIEQSWPFDQAQVLDALGDLGRARDYYDRALAIYDQFGYVVAAARTRQRLAGLT
jgi:tetratricopeptide (TPR) repeat protein